MSDTFTLQQLAELFNGEIHGDGDAVVSRLGTLQSADSDSLAFFSNPKYLSQLRESKAGVVIMQPKAAKHWPGNALLVDNPYLVYAKAAGMLHPAPELVAGVDPRAVVSDDAVVPASCEVRPGAVIESGVVLGERVYVGPNTCIGKNVRVGDDTRLLANVTLYHDVELGARCLIHSASVIGSDGFGNAQDADGSWTKVPQIGSVIVGDDVEMGAGCTIDRGAIENTVIGDGVRFDNQTHIGHNVEIGAHTAFAAQAGVSGSATVGARCQIGGHVAIAGHLSVCDNVGVMGKSGVSNNIKEPGIYSNGVLPLETAVQHNKNAVRFGQLDKMARTLKKVEARVLGDDNE